MLRNLGFKVKKGKVMLVLGIAFAAVVAFAATVGAASNKLA